MRQQTLEHNSGEHGLHSLAVRAIASIARRNGRVSWKEQAYLLKPESGDLHFLPKRDETRLVPSEYCLLWGLKKCAIAPESHAGANAFWLAVVHPDAGHACTRAIISRGGSKALNLPQY